MESVDAGTLRTNPSTVKKDAEISLILNGREEDLSPKQRAWINARKDIFGPEAAGEITKEQIQHLLDTGLDEVTEAISREKGSSGSMTNRGKTFLGALQEYFKDAKLIISGDIKSPIALDAVIDHAATEELEEAQSTSKIDLRAATTGIGIGKKGMLYTLRFPNTGLGQSKKEAYIQKAKNLPGLVENRIKKAKEFIQANFHGE